MKQGALSSSHSIAITDISAKPFALTLCEGLHKASAMIPYRSELVINVLELLFQFLELEKVDNKKIKPYLLDAMQAAVNKGDVNVNLMLVRCALTCIPYAEVIRILIEAALNEPVLLDTRNPNPKQRFAVLYEVVGLKLVSFPSSQFKDLMLFIKRHFFQYHDSDCVELVSNLFQSHVSLTDVNVECALEWAIDNNLFALIKDILVHRQHCTGNAIPSLKMFEIIIEKSDVKNLLRLLPRNHLDDFYSSHAQEIIKDAFYLATEKGTPQMIEVFLNHFEYLRHNEVVQLGIDMARITANIPNFLFLFNSRLIDDTMRSDIREILAENKQIVLIDALEKNRKNPLLLMMECSAEQDKLSQMMESLQFQEETSSSDMDFAPTFVPANNQEKALRNSQRKLVERSKSLGSLPTYKNI